MIIPVRCMSCGRVIGQLWETYKKKVDEGEDPKKVLDELGIKSYCCRSHFITHVDVAKDVMKFKR
ncbi:MAG: DNA-directed RNA polymerase subunit N [Candidatus Aenigmarchaeota archaeon]|nr:DNA-directed RNA polymerase subunit N [Candidatus Aenigmarchaeota archaeon]